MKHEFYNDNDADRPDVICDNNGQVVLAMCKVCGLAECSITSSCPGPNNVPDGYADKVCKGEVDFIGQTWVFAGVSAPVETIDTQCHRTLIEEHINNVLPNPPAEINVSPSVFCEDDTIPVCPNCGKNMVYDSNVNMWHCLAEPAPAFLPMEEYEALIKLAKALLKGANLCMQEQALIQPFFSIVKDNAKIIGDYDLFDEAPLLYNKYGAVEWMVLAELISELKYAYTLALSEYNQPQSKETIITMLENSLTILTKL
jgi:hypothetical protein